MDNHQEELARALKEKHYLEYCLPKVGHLFNPPNLGIILYFKNLIFGLNSIFSMSIVPFPSGNPRPINTELRKLFCL